MLIIRLQRVGRKNDPSFRIILTDSKRAAKTGSVLEILGSYDARKGKPALKNDRVLHWISVGAQTSNTVHNLLVSEKVIEGKKINVLPKKTPPKKEVVEEEKKEEVKAPEEKAEPAEIKEEPVAEPEVVEEKKEEVAVAE